MSGGNGVRVGDLLAGRYRLDRKLGQGGIGVVWRGHDLELGRAVAVKVLLEDSATSGEIVARFRREATIGARLQHQGITVVHDVGQEDGRLFIVMELLSGEDLAAVLARDGALEVGVAVDLAAQTAEALAAAHEQAVVHRDLKPANLFLLPGGRLKICDFGIAHSADATGRWTVTGRIFGTPAYMAPEQWRGERVGAACDLYALGCVLYALLSGEPPFGQFEVPYVLMRRHIEEDPVPLRRAGAAVPPELERLVQTLLAKDPSDRPASAATVGTTLRALLTPTPPPSYGPPPTGYGPPVASPGGGAGAAGVSDAPGGAVGGGAGGGVALAEGASGARAGTTAASRPGAPDGAGEGEPGATGVAGAGAEGASGAAGRTDLGARPGAAGGSGGNAVPAGGGRVQAGDGPGAPDGAGGGEAAPPADAWDGSAAAGGAAGGGARRREAGGGGGGGGGGMVEAETGVRPGRQAGPAAGAELGGGREARTGSGARAGIGAGAVGGGRPEAGAEAGPEAHTGREADSGIDTGSGVRAHAETGTGPGTGAGPGTGTLARPGTGTEAGVGARAAGGAEIRTQAEAEDETGPAAGAEPGGGVPGGAGGWWVGGGDVPPGVRDVVRGLVRDVEELLGGVGIAGVVRGEVLASAVDAAARIDAGLALRLLDGAERAAWAGGAGDGALTARLLTALARATAPHAPARARRLLTDAHQALFTVLGPDRRAALRAVAEELAAVAPEQAGQIAAYHFADGPAGSRLRARIASALAAADPRRAERELDRIADPVRQAAATYDMVVALAPRDLPAALRLSERIGSAGGRLLALCQLAQDRAAAGDTAGAVQALAQAEEWLPPVLRERAAWLREEAARAAEHGNHVEAERLDGRAAGLLRGRLEAAGGDEKAGHALAALEAARARVAEATLPPLDPAEARERAQRARSLPDPADRARELARVARACVVAGRSRWLPEAASEPGRSPVPPGRAEPSEAEAVAGGRTAWRAEARPDWMGACGDDVVWRAGAEVGRVSGRTGSTRWTAYADEGAPARPTAGGTVTVTCAGDARTVCVCVRFEADSATRLTRLVAREPGDGRVRWWRELPTASLYAVAGDRVVVTTPEGPVALDAATGETVWARTVGRDASRVVRTAGDLLVLVDDARLEAVRPGDGHVPWTRPRMRVGGGPARATGPARAGERLVHVLDGNVLRGLSRRTGLEVWQVEPGVAAAAGQAVVGEEDRGVVYAAAHLADQGRDVVFCLEAGTGRVVWQRPLTRRRAAGCGLELLGVGGGSLYVRVARPGRRGLLGHGRDAEPYVVALDTVTGRPRRQWDDPALADHAPLLLPHALLLPRPTLTAIPLP
ncbi:protein kinase [Streptomyces sp. NPDC032472]|uniref:protein kinase domain-containing protein n=1 Tax=Streptomyces sp. NPDC032472 TaxID=3155018 RepID=UPI0033E661B5